MNTNQLEYFIAAAEYQNFSKAAEKLHISQTAITQQVRLLETQLNVLLFERIGRNVKLTDAGRVFLTEAHSIIRHVTEAEQKVQSASFGYNGTVKIGFLKGCEQLGFPKLCAGFRADHPLASHASLSRTDLKNENLVHVRTSEEMLNSIYNEYAKSGFVPTFSAFPEDMESLLMTIAAGMGISIIPDYDLHLLDGFPTLKAVPLTETWDRFQIVICWNKKNSNPAAKLFIQFLQSQNFSPSIEDLP